MEGAGYVWVKSKSAHPPPPPPPPPFDPQAFDIFYFLLVKFPTMRALSLVKCPPPKVFLRGQMPGPRVEATKCGQIDFRKPERVS